MPLATGDNFAGFTIIRQLGSGGMGEVYLVDHPRLPRQEALKILPSGVSADHEFRGRFNREAELAATLWHPHIVAVHDRGDHHGQLWITMDFVEGTDAARLLTEQFPSGLPPAFAVEIVAAVADALDYAHERGLLHRDVKPANILLSGTEPEARNRRILLSDFGIAREIEDTAKLTATNMAVGSISYAAPEQLMGQALDGRADQYALAATAFQLLTGRPPFENSNAAVVITSHLSTPPPQMAQRRPDLGVFDPVMNRALAKKPQDRYPSCRDFADGLKGLVDSGGGGGGGGVAHPTLIGTPAAGGAGETGGAQSATVPAYAGAQVQARQEASAKPAGRRGVWIAAVAVVAALAIAAVVLIPGFTGSDDHSKSDASAPPSSGETTSAEPTSTEKAAALIPASSVESLMLTDAQLSAIVGTPVTIAETFKAPYDSSPTLSPLSCAAAVMTGEATALDTISYTAMLQDLARPGDGQPGNAHVEQTVVLTPSEEAAAQFLSDSTERWQRCSGTVVTNADPYWTTIPSDVRVDDNVIVLDRPVEGFSVPDYRCQHALGTWSNVIAEGLVCNDGPIGDAAQRIVEDVLANAQAG